MGLDFEREGIRLGGIASLPTYNRGVADHQFLFVNGRPVKDRLLIGAVRGAYAEMLARDRHAVVALFLDLPPTEVDVNVHPAKTEVRFREPALIRGMIVSGLRHALDQSGFRAVQRAAEVEWQQEPVRTAQGDIFTAPYTAYQGNYAAASGIPVTCRTSKRLCRFSMKTSPRSWGVLRRPPNLSPKAAATRSVSRADRWRTPILLPKPRTAWCWSTNMPRMNGWCSNECARQWKQRAVPFLRRHCSSPKWSNSTNRPATVWRRAPKNSPPSVST